MKITIRLSGRAIRTLQVVSVKAHTNIGNMMNKMNIEQLSELMAFYHLIGNICGEVLEQRLRGDVNECFKDMLMFT